MEWNVIIKILKNANTMHTISVDRSECANDNLDLAVGGSVTVGEGSCSCC